MNHRTVAFLSGALGITFGFFLSELPWVREESVARADLRQGRPERVLDARPEALRADPAPTELTRPPAPMAESSIRTEVLGDPNRRVALTEAGVTQLVQLLGPDWATPISKQAVGVGPTLAGVPHGDWVLTYAKTGRREIGAFALGARVGPWKVIDMNGDTIQTSNYINGILEGTLRERASVDARWISFSYVHGELQ